jgi:hypothetical protein
MISLDIQVRIIEAFTAAVLNARAPVGYPNEVGALATRRRCTATTWMSKGANHEPLSTFDDQKLPWL